jgi:hypothetical protein
MEDANAFVMDEDEESDWYGLRVSGHDLVGVSHTTGANLVLTPAVSNGRETQDRRSATARIGARKGPTVRKCAVVQ